jgi:hypothetical protein
LKRLESAICEHGGNLVHGGAYDRWDFEVRSGLLGAVRLLMTVEEHGGGRQMFRYRLSPRYTMTALVAFLPPALLTAGAVLDGVWSVAAVFGLLSAFLAVYSVLECGSAIGVLQRALQREHARQPLPDSQVAQASAVLPGKSPIPIASINR